MLALAVLFALLLSSGVAEAACLPTSAEQAGRAVKQARAELKAVHIEEMEEDVPPLARTRIEQLKDKLRAFVAATMACAADGIDVKALQGELSANGDAFVPGEFHGEGYTIDHFDGDGEGHSLTYDVKAIASHPDMVGVTATLGIECGEDTLLMLYQRQGRDWREAVVRRSAPYKDISGAWMSFQYAVSPSDAQGRWYMATSNIPPWCTSVWRSIRYDLSRPGARADRPDIFFSRSAGAYIGNDDSGQLKADASAFEVRHEVGSVSFDVFSRPSVRRYAVAGDTVTRIPPVALNARDFVDEWIVSPWSDAEKWSAIGLLGAHTRLAALSKQNGSADNAFEGIRACIGGANQVELTMGESGNWFFEVAYGPPFQMRKVSQYPSSACTGPPVAIDKP
jgi:hypothetical protein